MAIMGQRYDADGSPIGNEFKISTDTVFNVARPYVEALNDGGFIVAWRTRDEQNGGGVGEGIRAEIFDADGNAMVVTAFYGDAGDNTLTGGDAREALYGQAGDDTLIGGSGDDILNGGDGIDTAVFAGNMANYTISQFGYDINSPLTNGLFSGPCFH